MLAFRQNVRAIQRKMLYTPAIWKDRGIVENIKESCDKVDEIGLRTRKASKLRGCARRSVRTKARKIHELREQHARPENGTILRPKTFLASRASLFDRGALSAIHTVGTACICVYHAIGMQLSRFLKGRFLGGLMT